MKQNKKIEIQDLGLMDYKKAWDYQTGLLETTMQLKLQNRKTENPNEILPTTNHLLLVEHPHVYTLGKSGDVKHLLASEEKLKNLGASFHKINRGGDITYHGPQQMVVYPILDLENFFTDIHKYLRLLEECIIKIMADYDLKGVRSKGETGVWLDVGKPYARKICALGVKASRWITMHGLALNVNTDLSYFEHIIPCGIQNKAVTSLERELERTISMEQVKEKFLNYFFEVFQAERK